MSSSEQAELVLDGKSLNGENPLWAEREQALYWIDIEEPAVHRFDPASGTDRGWRMPAETGAIALCRSGRLLAALRTGLTMVDLLRGASRFLAAPPYDPLTHRFNGGKCDAAGRFWIGTMHKPIVEQEAAQKAQPVHIYDAARGLEPLGVCAVIANGFDWSLDRHRFYLSDSDARVIRAFDYDPATGALGAGREFARFAKGRPDGAAVDAEDGYWAAIHGEGRVVRLTADGRIDREIRLPVSQPTMCAFGGPALDQLYITTASSGLSDEARRREPLAGGLFRCTPGVRGRPTALFDD